MLQKHLDGQLCPPPLSQELPWKHSHMPYSNPQKSPQTQGEIAGDSSRQKALHASKHSFPPGKKSVVTHCPGTSCDLKPSLQTISHHDMPELLAGMIKACCLRSCLLRSDLLQAKAKGASPGKRIYCSAWSFIPLTPGTPSPSTGLTQQTIHRTRWSTAPARWVWFFSSSN